MTGTPDQNETSSGVGRRRFIGTAAAGGVAAWATPAILGVGSASAAGTPAPGEGTVQGRVTDASTSAPIAGAQVQVAGLSATTDGNGDYSISGVPAGTHTVTAAATDYTSASTLATVPAGGTATVNFALSALGDLRVVLTWNALEGDLDLHMSGPDGGGADGRFHAYYFDRNPVSHVSLDLDDTNGEGPETMTITVSGTDYVPGEYRVWVHDFPSFSADGLNFIGAEAVVTFSDRTSQVAQYRPTDPGHTGDPNQRIWRVFDFTIDANGELTGPVTTHFEFLPGDQGTTF